LYSFHRTLFILVEWCQFVLRGLDSDRSDADPIVVKVADRRTHEGTVTAYLRTDVTAVVRKRQARVRGALDQVADAGVVGAVDVVEWPERVRGPPETMVAAAALDLYDEFTAAIDAEPLVPFFEARDGVGGAARVVDLPAICLAYRVDGDLAGLYPRWRDGHHDSIEDCLRWLCAGGPLRNV
jgi:hypothetical protein